MPAARPWCHRFPAHTQACAGLKPGLKRVHIIGGLKQCISNALSRAAMAASTSATARRNFTAGSSRPIQYLSRRTRGGWPSMRRGATVRVLQARHGSETFEITGRLPGQACEAKCLEPLPPLITTQKVCVEAKHCILQVFNWRWSVRTGVLSAGFGI